MEGDGVHKEMQIFLYHELLSHNYQLERKEVELSFKQSCEQNIDNFI